MNKFDVQKSTVLLVLVGSRAYGFHTAKSDYDYRGIVIPPMTSYFSLEPRFEQIVTKNGKQYYPSLDIKDSDLQAMEILKFTTLALSCNPSIIEILFSDEENIIYKHKVIDKLLENRDLFLSKQAKARFCGYAVSQLNRIKLHKRWIANPPNHSPTRAEFGLPERLTISKDQLGAAESLIKKEVEQFTLMQDDLPEHTKIDLENGLTKMLESVWVALNKEPFPINHSNTIENILTEQAIENNFEENFIETLRKERKYQTAKKEWDNYQTWLKERNPARAELEKKYLFDCKHATHLIRLLRMSEEIISTGKVLVKRPDAEELLAIRNGSMTYEQVCEYAETQQLKIEGLMKDSPLPKEPDKEKIQQLVYDIIVAFNKN